MAFLVPMPPHVLHGHEVNEIALNALFEFGLGHCALHVGETERQLIKPELEIAGLPKRINIVVVVKNLEQNRVRKSQGHQFAIDVIKFDERVGLALTIANMQLERDEKQTNKRYDGGSQRNNMIPRQHVTSPFDRQLSGKRLIPFGLIEFGCQGRGMDYSPRYGQFRATLRRIRVEAGLSQTGLAAKLGKSQTFVSRSELGERRIDFI